MSVVHATVTSDVIDPAETRQRLCRVLARLSDRAVTRAGQTTKKHPVDTW